MREVLARDSPLLFPESETDLLIVKASNRRRCTVLPQRAFCPNEDSLIKFNDCFDRELT